MPLTSQYHRTRQRSGTPALSRDADALQPPRSDSAEARIGGPTGARTNDTTAERPRRASHSQSPTRQRNDQIADVIADVHRGPRAPAHARSRFESTNAIAIAIAAGAREPRACKADPGTHGPRSGSGSEAYSF